MAIAVEFGSYSFPTKTSARKEIQRRINSYDFGEELNDGDHDFFFNLFGRHDEFDEKKGPGIDKFVVTKDIPKGDRFITIHRIDGTIIDISWVQCLNPKSEGTIISESFRRAIYDYIMEYKSECLKTECVCPITGNQLNYSNSEVTYHDNSFKKLLTNFMEKEKINISVSDINDDDPMDNDNRGLLKSKSIFLKWRDYISKNANLKLTYSGARQMKDNK